MSQQTSETRIPELTLGWRLKMALGDMKAQDMAVHLGVSRQTITRWVSDHGAPPARAYVLQWAMATGTDAAWLETGLVPGDDNGPDGGTQLTPPHVAPVAVLAVA